MQLPVDRTSRAYLEFVQGYKLTLPQALMQATRSRLAGLEPAPDSWTAVKEAFDAMPSWRTYGFVQRSSQEMMWTALMDVIGQNAALIDAQLAAERPGLGSLALQDGLVPPAYFTESDIHLRPLDLWQERGQGFVSGIANSVYFGGRNDRLEGQTWAVDQLPDLPEGARVLDLGCGTGQSTWPLAARYPGAELHALDLPAELCRFAWREAQDRGLSVHVRQAAAEDTGYPDGHFDLVFAFILFHEVPDDAAAAILAEARRILKPGGTFALCDVRPYAMMDPVRAAIMDWQVEGNGEAFWRQHGLRDYPALFATAGFAGPPEQVLRPDERTQTMVWIARTPA